ncbi:unnamed protein product [Danaus chrysippus]|uniref:(African queen) hypothetical protein n=1 Tax=Danaus chrysippus TaxID=151541 RepID=A0A8J2MI97_9NEOP|nr:unnamed protein product [Danaus chrysippus]
MEASYQGGVSFEDNDNFKRLSSTIASNIKKISQNVSSMSKMVNQLQTPQDSQELRNQLRQIQNYTQKLAKDTSSLIMELMKTPTDIPANKLTRERLSDEYMSTLNAFQATQRSAAQKSKDDVRKVKAQNINIGDPFALGGGEGVELGERVVRQSQLSASSERELQQLEERERDIRQLENDIMDVNQIFKELGSMIHEQGAVVESIESNVEDAATNVESAARELSQAATYKVKSLRSNNDVHNTPKNSFTVNKNTLMIIVTKVVSSKSNL